MKPGSLCNVAALPRPAILLESAGTIAGRRGRHEYLWVLWRFDFEREVWTEIARAQSLDDSWKHALVPRAEFALRAGKPRDPTPILELVSRIMRVIDEELKAIPPEDRHALLAALDPEFFGRLASFL